MIIAVQGVRDSLSRLPAGSIGDIVLASYKKGVKKLKTNFIALLSSSKGELGEDRM
jgi:hypothetical protein